MVVNDGLAARVPASLGEWRYLVVQVNVFCPVTTWTQRKTLWHFRKVGEDLVWRSFRRWRKRLSLAVCSSSLSCPAEAGSVYRTGQEMPLSGACMTSAEMCVDVNMLGNKVFPTITFVGDLT